MHDGKMFGKPPASRPAIFSIESRRREFGSVRLIDTAGREFRPFPLTSPMSPTCV